MNNADKQILFDAGDEVWFSAAGKGRLRGSIQKLNPTRARVRCGAEFWNVPYGGLNHVCQLKAKERKKRMAQLMEVDAQARELMDRHGLADWSFRFNDAEKKLGVCRDRGKQILLSRGHAANGARNQVTDTILHETGSANIAKTKFKTGTDGSKCRSRSGMESCGTEIGRYTKILRARNGADTQKTGTRKGQIQDWRLCKFQSPGGKLARA